MSELVKVMNVHGMDVSRIKHLKSVFSCVDSGAVGRFACVLSACVLWPHALQYKDSHYYIIFFGNRMFV